MKRVKNARKALKVWEREAKSLDAKGYKKDPIESREQECMRYAMANPMVPVDDIKLGIRGVRTRKAKDRQSAPMAKMPKYEMMGSIVIFGMSPPKRKAKKRTGKRK